MTSVHYSGESLGSTMQNSVGAESRGALKPQVANSPRSTLRVGFICGADPLNLQLWSGTPFHMLQALREEFEVSVVVRHPWSWWFRALRRAVRSLTAGRVELSWFPWFARMGSIPARRRLERAKLDYVIIVANRPLADILGTRVRVVHISDATFKALEGYHPHFTRSFSFIKNLSSRSESRCIQQAKYALYPSNWARNSAILDHGGRPDRCQVIPWGANLPPSEQAERQERDLSKVRLLFVGLSFLNKGGDVALATVQRLRAMGVDAELDLVGPAPASQTPPTPGVRFHGALSKSDPNDLAKLMDLYAQAHVFLLPTRFEALGIVFAEAAQFGVPSVAYRTGGVDGMVIDGETGILLPEDATAEMFAEVLKALVTDPERYHALARGAQARSRSELDWRIWARSVRAVLEAD